MEIFIKPLYSRLHSSQDTYSVQLNFVLFKTTNMDATFSLTTGYVIGAFIALLILFYLLYALIKPEKF